MKCVPLFSRILSLFAESNDLQYAVPGGLIGVGTMIDPTLTRADRLVGQVLGSVGHLPQISTEMACKRAKACFEHAHPGKTFYTDRERRPSCTSTWKSAAWSPRPTGDPRASNGTTTSSTTTRSK